MILIIHGNDTESSRNYLLEEKNKTANPIVLNGEGLIFNDFFQASENKTFFEEKSKIIIENFFLKNKPNSAEFKLIIDYLSKEKKSDIIFWENGEISKAAQSLIKGAVVKNFSLPQKLFLFLDNIKPNNAPYSIRLFHEVKENTEVEIIFFMIIRHFRLLLSFKEDSLKQIEEVKKMAPWQIAKLKKQLEHFDKNRLLKIYDKLFEIEINHKTGKVPYSLDNSIDFLLADL